MNQTFEIINRDMSFLLSARSDLPFAEVSIDPYADVVARISDANFYDSQPPPGFVLVEPQCFRPVSLRFQPVYSIRPVHPPPFGGLPVYACHQFNCKYCIGALFDLILSAHSDLAWNMHVNRSSNNDGYDDDDRPMVGFPQPTGFQLVDGTPFLKYTSYNLDHSYSRDYLVKPVPALMTHLHRLRFVSPDEYSGPHMWYYDTGRLSTAGQSVIGLLGAANSKGDGPADLTPAALIPGYAGPYDALSKNRLQEAMQRRNLPFPVYQVSMFGPPHIPVFQCEVYIHGPTGPLPPFTGGRMSSRREAEFSAAACALEYLLSKWGIRSDRPVKTPALEKSALKEYCDREGLGEPIYNTHALGVGNIRTWMSTVVIRGNVFASLKSWNTKKEAESEAAGRALAGIRGQSFPDLENAFSTLQIEEVREPVAARLRLTATPPIPIPPPALPPISPPVPKEKPQFDRNAQSQFNNVRARIQAGVDVLSITELKALRTELSFALDYTTRCIQSMESFKTNSGSSDQYMIGMLGSGNSKGDGPTFFAFDLLPFASSRYVQCEIIQAPSFVPCYVNSLPFRPCLFRGRSRFRTNSRPDSYDMSEMSAKLPKNREKKERRFDRKSHRPVRIVTDGSRSARDDLIFRATDAAEHALLCMAAPNIRSKDPSVRESLLRRMIERKRSDDLKNAREQKEARQRSPETMKLFDIQKVNMNGTGSVFTAPQLPSMPSFGLPDLGIGATYRAVNAVGELPALVRDTVKQLGVAKAEFLTYIDAAIDKISKITSEKIDQAAKSVDDRIQKAEDSSVRLITIGILGSLLAKFIYDSTQCYNPFTCAMIVVLSIFLLWYTGTLSQCVTSLTNVLLYYSGKQTTNNLGKDDMGTIFALVFSSAFLKTSPPHMLMKHIGDVAMNFKRYKEGSTSFFEITTDSFIRVWNVIARYLGVNPIKQSVGGVKEVEDYVDRCETFIAQFEQKSINVDRDSLSRLNILRQEGTRISMKYARDAAHTVISSVVNRYLIALNNILQIYSARGVSNVTTRMEPLLVRLFGHPGVGKSVLLINLEKDILFELYRDNNEILTRLVNDPYSLIYNRQPEHEYWDGYTPFTLIVNYDDWGQQAETVATADNEYMEIIRAGQIFDYVLHSAAIQDKGNMHFGAKMIFCTTNLPKITTNLVRCPGALERRFKFQVQVIPHRDFVADTSIPIDKWMLDPKKCGDEFNKNVYTFTSIDEKNHFKDISYEEFKAKLIAEYRALEAKFENFFAKPDRARDNLIREQIKKNAVIKPAPPVPQTGAVGDLFEKTHIPYVHKPASKPSDQKVNMNSGKGKDPVPEGPSEADEEVEKAILDAVEREYAAIQDTFLPGHDPDAIRAALYKKYKANAPEMKTERISPPPSDECLPPTGPPLEEVEAVHLAQKERLDPSEFPDHDSGYAKFIDPDMNLFSKYFTTRCQRYCKNLDPSNGYQQEYDLFQEFDKMSRDDLLKHDRSIHGHIDLYAQFARWSFEKHPHLSEISCAIIAHYYVSLYLSLNLENPDEKRLAENLLKKEEFHKRNILIGLAHSIRRTDFNDAKDKERQRVNSSWATQKLQTVSDIISDWLQALGAAFLVPCTFLEWVGKIAITIVVIRLAIWGIGALLRTTKQAVVSTINKITGSTHEIGEDEELLVNASGEPRKQTTYRRRRIGVKHVQHVNCGPDNTCVDVVTKIMNGNMFIIPNHGVVLFLYDRVMVLNQHLVDHFRKSKLADNDSLVIKSASGSVELNVLVGDIRNSIRLTANEERDLAVCYASTVVPRPDIRRHIISENSMDSIASSPILAPVMRFDEKGLPTGSMFHILNSDIDSAIDATSDDGVVYHYERFWKYNNFGLTVGHSGTPVFLYDSRRRSKLAGIHSSSSSVYGCAVVFTTEMLNEIEELFPVTISEPRDLVNHTNSVSDLNRDVYYPNSTINPTPIPGLPFVRYSPAPRLGGKSKIILSEMGEIGLEGFERKTLPASTKEIEVDGKLVNPTLLALSRYAKNQINPANFDIFEIAAQYKLHHIMKNESRRPVRKMMSYERAVLGDSEDSIWKSIPRGTSFGYIMGPDNKPVHLKSADTTKKYFFGDGPSFDLTNPNALWLRSKVMSIIDDARKGIRQEHVYMDCPKMDERRKIEKVKAGKVRFVSACPLPLLIAFRMMFGNFALSLMHNRIRNGLTAGINVHSEEWTHCLDRMRHVGTNYMAGDVDGCDTSLDQRGLEIIFEQIIIPWFDDRDEDLARRTLSLEVTNSKHIYLTMIYEWLGRMPSGVFITNFGTGLYIECAFRTVFAALHPRGVAYGLDTFDKDCYIMTHGDDHVLSVSDNVKSWFNPLTIVAKLRFLGLNITPTDKKSQFTEAFLPLSEVTFLKRNFRYEPALDSWVAPLELDVVLESWQWTRYSATPETIAMDTFKAMMIELSLHDPKVFATWAPRCFETFRLAYKQEFPLKHRGYLLALSRSLLVEY